PACAHEGPRNPARVRPFPRVRHAERNGSIGRSLNGKREAAGGGAKEHQESGSGGEEKADRRPSAEENADRVSQAGEQGQAPEGRKARLVPPGKDRYRCQTNSRVRARPSRRSRPAVPSPLTATPRSGNRIRRPVGARPGAAPGPMAVRATGTLIAECALDRAPPSRRAGQAPVTWLPSTDPSRRHARHRLGERRSAA